MTTSEIMDLNRTLVPPTFAPFHSTWATQLNKNYNCGIIKRVHYTPLQTKVFIILYMLPFIPLHFLCTHFWQLVHCIELLPTPPPQTPHGILQPSALPSATPHHSKPWFYSLMPLFSTLTFHSWSLFIRPSSVSAITTRSSAYNNSHGKATLNSLDKASMTIINSKGLNAEPWCIPTYSPKTVMQWFGVFWQRFGSKLRYVWLWPPKISWQPNGRYDVATAPCSRTSILHVSPVTFLPIALKPQHWPRTWVDLRKANKT